MTPLRVFLSVLLGFLAGSIVNMALVSLAPVFVSPPPGVNPTDMESLKASMHLFGPEHFVFPFLAHALGTLVGSVVAFFIAPEDAWWPAWLIGVLFLAGGISASFVIPAPAWFIALDLVVAYLPMAWLGIRIGRALRDRRAAA